MLHRVRLLPYAHCTFRKARPSLWSTTVRIERRARLKHGAFLQWHQPEDDLLRRHILQAHWVIIPQWWLEWELPQGFWAELGPSLAYVCSQVIQDHTSRWWVVVVTQWVVEVMTFLVWDDFDTWHLWWLTHRLLTAYYKLVQVVSLSCEGADDALRFVNCSPFSNFSRSFNWDRLPAFQALRKSETQSGPLDVLAPLETFSRWIVSSP